MIYKGVKYYVAGQGYYMTSRGKYLHHEILPAKKGFHVDHINGDKLDNRPENLRYVTPQQNAWNKLPWSKTGKMLVTYDKSSPTKPYKVQVRRDGKNKHIGRYYTLEDASEVAKAVVQETYGEYARAS